MKPSGWTIKQHQCTKQKISSSALGLTPSTMPPEAGRGLRPSWCTTASPKRSIRGPNRVMRPTVSVQQHEHSPKHSCCSASLRASHRDSSSHTDDAVADQWPEASADHHIKLSDCVPGILGPEQDGKVQHSPGQGIQVEPAYFEVFEFLHCVWRLQI